MKKCEYCDSMIPDTAKFCPNCGANQLSQIEGANPPAAPAPPEIVPAVQPQQEEPASNTGSYPFESGAGSTGTRQTYLLLSIISIFFFLPCGVIATIFSVNAAKAPTDAEYMRKARTAKIWAIAGIVIGALGIIGKLL